MTGRFPFFHDLYWRDVYEPNRFVYVSHQPQRKALHWAVIANEPAAGGDLIIANYGSLKRAVAAAMLDAGAVVLQQDTEGG